MKNNTGSILTAANLKIGDVVNFKDGAENSAFLDLTVVNKTENEIIFFRAFVHLGGFTHTGGVTPYIGTETFSVPVSSSGEYILRRNIYYGQI